MRREPFIYGMPHDEPRDDPQLGNKRNALIVQSARQLSAAKMIRFDEISHSFQISDLGRIAAKYYLRYQTIEVFSEPLVIVKVSIPAHDRYHVQRAHEKRRSLRDAVSSHGGRRKCIGLEQGQRLTSSLSRFKSGRTKSQN
jgi:hypothetical protein